MTKSETEYYQNFCNFEDYKFLGKNVKIFPDVKIVNKKNVFIGDYSQIDDFVFINGGKETKIGKYVHIASFSSVIGGGKFYMGDLSGLAAGCRIITVKEDYLGNTLNNPCVPDEYRTLPPDTFVKIGKYVTLGTNTIVHPNVTIGEGAVTGSGTVVLNDLEPYGIYVGCPARKVKDRKKDFLKMANELIME